MLLAGDDDPVTRLFSERDDPGSPGEDVKTCKGSSIWSDQKPTLHAHAPARNQPSVAKVYAEGVVRADRSVGPDPNH